VTDPTPDLTSPDTTPPSDAAEAADPTPATDETPDAVARRAFVRRMGTDAVRTAGTVFSLSRILTRSAVAAGQAITTELEGLQVGDPAEEVVAPEAAVAVEATPAEPPALPAESAAPTESVLSAPPAALAVDPARPPLTIDPEQRAILEAAPSAIVAVNLPGRAPQLTSATILWDGETIRFATLGWARRTTMLRADPNVGLLVEGPGDGRFVTVLGRARVVDGLPTKDAMLPLLRREVGGDEADTEARAEARWQELYAADIDRAVIVIEPEQVLSGRR
jgi:hypothetical protein